MPASHSRKHLRPRFECEGGDRARIRLSAHFLGDDAGRPFGPEFQMSTGAYERWINAISLDADRSKQSRVQN